jgi:phosphoglycerate dehydrogenase-like enzyme
MHFPGVLPALLPVGEEGMKGILEETRMESKILFVLNEIEWSTFFPGGSADTVKSLGAEIRLVDPTGLSEDAWRRELSEFQPRILVAAWKTPALPEDVTELTGGKLDYVCYLAGSVRKLVTREHLEAGLLVTNWGNIISRTVAECGLMLAIGALRRASYWQIGMHLEGQWKTPQTVTGSLFERKVGIHGFGAISQALTGLLQPYDVEISTYSPSVPDSLLEDHGVNRAESLEDLFAKNDVIFELAALTSRNRGIVTEELLRMIPEGGAFVNIGRGAVVDEEALARVAAEGKIQVGLDVYGKEPLPEDSPFRGMRNVMMLPHLGGPTTDRRQDSGRLAIANIRRFYEGSDLEAVISPEVYARST